MSVLQTVLSPIIFVLDWILRACFSLTGSLGASILLLSLVVFVGVAPLRRFARRLQQQETDLQAQMAGPLRDAKAQFRGEDRFHAIDRVYQQFNYHPLMSMRTAMGVAIQIPFLLSALLLLVDYPEAKGQSFLLVRDLGAADGLIPLPFGQAIGAARVNLLPILMLVFSFLEGHIASLGNVAATLKVNLAGVVLFFLAYSVPAAVLLYWTSSSLLSLMVAVVNARKTAAGEQRGR